MLPIVADLNQLFPNSEPAEHADLDYAPGEPLVIDGPTFLRNVGLEIVSTEGGPNLYQLWQETRGPEEEEQEHQEEEARTLSQEELDQKREREKEREYEFNIPSHLTRDWPRVSSQDRPRLAYQVKGQSSEGRPEIVQVGYLFSEGKSHAQKDERQETTGSGEPQTQEAGSQKPEGAQF